MGDPRTGRPVPRAGRTDPAGLCPSERPSSRWVAAAAAGPVTRVALVTRIRRFRAGLPTDWVPADRKRRRYFRWNDSEAISGIGPDPKLDAADSRAQLRHRRGRPAGPCRNAPHEQEIDDAVRLAGRAQGTVIRTLHVVGTTRSNRPSADSAGDRVDHLDHHTEFLAAGLDGHRCRCRVAG